MNVSTADPDAAASLTDAIHLHWIDWQHGIGRAPLRRILASYLALNPESVDIVQPEPSAKPFLSGNPMDLRFNWSHSGDVALVAVSRGIELGVDVESGARPVRALALARRFYAPEECTALEQLPESDQAREFLRLWTGKEALLKALGHGIGNGLDRVVLASNGTDALRIQRIDLEPASARPMQLRTLKSPRPDLLACLAWIGSHRRVVDFRDTLSFPAHHD